MPSIAEEVMGQWEEGNVFQRSVDSRPKEKRFVFFEGPPSANGKPGIHHVMARALKDLFCRYRTLKGERVERKAGWDTHGLPVELGVEKALGITKEDIGKKISVEEYNTGRVPAPEREEQRRSSATAEPSDVNSLAIKVKDIEAFFVNVDLEDARRALAKTIVELRKNEPGVKYF